MAAYFFSSMFPLQVENVGKLSNNEWHNTMKIPFLLFNISNTTQGCVSMLWHHCWVWLHVQQSTSLTTQWQLKLLFEETTNLFWGTWTRKLLSAKLGVVRGQTGCRLTKWKHLQCKLAHQYFSHISYLLLQMKECKNCGCAWETMCQKTIWPLTGVGKKKSQFT